MPMFAHFITSPKNKSYWLIGLLFCSLTPSVFALQKDVEQPVTIESDTAMFDKAAGKASYDGNVVIHQGTLEVLAAHVDILAPNNQIQHIIAKGSPVNFKQDMDSGKVAKGKAASMEYFVLEKRLVLTGNAEVQQDQDKLASNFIEYRTAEGQINAGGGKGKTNRVTAVFMPTNKAQ